VTAAVGLKFSLGKNYTHRRCLILNSQLFQHCQEVDFFGQVRPRLWRLPHLEVGLLFGQVKGTSRDEREEALHTSSPYLDSARSLAQMAADLIEPWPVYQKRSLLRKFLRHNGELLMKVPSGMSWFLPRQLGGLGLPIVVTDDPLDRPSFSIQQLRLAAYLATRSLDDPCLRDIVVPDLPPYLKADLNEMNRLSDKLGIEPEEWSGNPQDLKRESQFTNLRCWAGSCEAMEEPRRPVERAFRCLWKAGLRCDLSPMGWRKACAYRRFVLRPPVRWC
jgi:hypothetical protein